MKSLVPVLLLWIVLLSSSCEYLGFNVTTKNEYMQNYQDFIVKVQDNYNAYNRKDWETADKKMETFSHEMYKKYTNELSFRDKLTIGKYPIMYYLSRYKAMLNDEIDDKYRDDTRMILKNLIEIMDSTAHVYDVFDDNVRGMLQDFRSRIELEEEKQARKELERKEQEESYKINGNDGINTSNEQEQQ